MIGVDLDEILCPTLRYHCIFLNRKYNLNLSEDDFFTYEFCEVYGVSKKQAIKDFLEFSGTKLFRDIEPFEDAIEEIENLRQIGRLCVITSRQNNLRDFTIEWLERFFPRVFSKTDFGNFYSLDGKKTSKLELCRRNNIELLVEDDSRHATKVSKNIPVLLLDKPWNQRLTDLDRQNIVRVYNWKEVVGVAKEILL